MKVRRRTMSDYVVVLYKVVEYRAEVKVSAKDSNEAMTKARDLYSSDTEYVKTLNWVVNSEKLAEVGVLLPHAPVSER
jgi:flagellum-specific peptidoglycan hydrolase FlgJ